MVFIIDYIEDKIIHESMFNRINIRYELPQTKLKLELKNISNIKG